MIASKAAPFPGLRPFGKADAPWFFGRTAQIADLRRRLDRTRLVAVVGGSGVGKSSLIYAGLMPWLERETGWLLVETKPRGAPRAALAEAFTRALAETGLITPEEIQSAAVLDHVGTTMDRSAFGLVNLVREWMPRADRRVLVLVDQFEEVFRFNPQTGGRDLLGAIEDEAAAFASLLLAAAADDGVPINVVLTMRAEYIGDCIRFEGLPEAINEGQYLVPRLTREQTESVICEPIAGADAEIDHDLVQRLLNESSRELDALPVLQHLLMRLWEASRQKTGERRLTLELDAGIGGMRDALSNHADSVTLELRRALGERTGLAAEQVMRALTDVDREGRPIRRPIPLHQLVKETGFDRRVVTTVLEAMRAETRAFLRPGPEVDLHSDVVIDISHESLIRQWRTLNDWVEKEAESAKTYRRLSDSGRRWKVGKAATWRDPDLTDAYEWKEEQKPNRTWASRYGGGYDVAMEFLEESKRETQRARSSGGLWIFLLDSTFSWQSPYRLGRDWAFQDGGGHTRLIITADGVITVIEGYAWDGATPKVYLLDVVWGTPDGVDFLGTGRPKTYYATLVHDALYQFLPDGLPLSRAQADRCFLLLMTEHQFALRHVYWLAVRLFGGLSCRITRRLRRTYGGLRLDCTALSQPME